MKPVFDKDGLAIEAGNIFCYYYDPITKEYTGWSDEFIHVGVSMPGSSTDIEPSEQKEGFTLVFDGESWLEMEDRRGEVVYSTENGMELKVDYIGPLRDGFTTKPPASDFDKWDGGKWVLDAYAAHAADVEAAVQNKSNLRKIADSEIEWRKYAVDKGVATDAESVAFDEWNLYRVLLMRIDVSKAPDIEWPTTPSA